MNVWVEILSRDTRDRGEQRRRSYFLSRGDFRGRKRTTVAEYMIKTEYPSGGCQRSFMAMVTWRKSLPWLGHPCDSNSKRGEWNMEDER